MRPRNIYPRCPLQKMIIARPLDHSRAPNGTSTPIRKSSVQRRYGVFRCFYMQLYRDYHEVSRNLNVFRAVMQIIGLR